jgi:hypothetical protein
MEPPVIATLAVPDEAALEMAALSPYDPLLVLVCTEPPVITTVALPVAVPLTSASRT